MPVDYQPDLMLNSLERGAACPADGLWNRFFATGHSHPRQKDYEVELVTLAGQTAAIVTASTDQIRPIGKDKIPHARELAHR